MQIKISVGSVMRWLVGTAALLVIIHSIVLAIYFHIDDPNQFDFVRLIDLDYEGNIPTLFSVLLFLLNGLLFFLIFRIEKSDNKKFARYWLGLAVIFIFLGFDEGTRLHEEIGDLFEKVVEAEGLLYFPWVIPYSILFGIAVLVYFRFYLSLDRKFQIQLFLAAVIFLSGALGVEILSAKQADELGTSSLSYSILYTIEESLEMSGLLYLIYILLNKIRLTQYDLSFHLQ